MVKILPNGEIVPDNDPRVGSASQRNPPTNAPRQGSVHQIGAEQPMMQHAPGGSFLDTFNRQLAGLGIPTWYLGPYDVQPITSFAFLIALLFLSFGGLFFALLLFFIVKYSQMGLGNGRSIQMPQFLQNLGFGGAGGAGGAEPQATGVRSAAPPPGPVPSGFAQLGLRKSSGRFVVKEFHLISCSYSNPFSLKRM